jgi:hypothetical protein
MRQVSIIALLIANAVQLGMMFAIMALVALAGLVGDWLWVGLPANIAPITEGLKASSFFMSLVGIISVVPASLTAGYLAGRMAHRHPVLHGALSSAGWFIVLLVFILLGGPSSNQPPHAGTGNGNGASSVPVLLGMILFFGPPLFGAVGGMISQSIGQGRGGTRVASATPADRFVEYR